MGHVLDLDVRLGDLGALGPATRVKASACSEIPGPGPGPRLPRASSLLTKVNWSMNTVSRSITFVEALVKVVDSARSAAGLMQISVVAKDATLEDASVRFVQYI